MVPPVPNSRELGVRTGALLTLCYARVHVRYTYEYSTVLGTPPHSLEPPMHTHTVPHSTDDFFLLSYLPRFSSANERPQIYRGYENTP